MLSIPAWAGPGWPEFRGSQANGDAGAAKLPLHWGEAENVAWKTPIPYLGWSTPTILEGRVWLTTATEEGNDFFVIAVEAASGKVLHNKKLFHADNPEPLSNPMNCYASPTPILEPGRVYVHFGTYGTACLDAATAEVVWQRTDFECRHYRGPGSSPVVYQNLLILSFDGVDQQYLAAVDKLTGATVWKTPRSTVFDDLDENGVPKRDGDARKAFCTPIFINVDGTTQMVSLGSSRAFGYDPLTGRELWSVPMPGHTSSSRPVFGGGLLFASTGHGQTEFWAIRPGTPNGAAQVAWQFVSRDAPQIPSPILVDGLLYIVSNAGKVTCLEPDTGREVWSENIGGSYMASPIHADGRLYFSSMQGNVTVLKTGRTFEVLAVNKHDDGFMASPAVVGDTLYLRTKSHLYRIEDKAQ